MSLLSDYGPIGLLVFCSLVLLPTSWRFFRNAKTSQRPPARFLFILSTCSTFALLLANVAVGIVNAHSGFVIRGRLIGLEPEAEFVAPFASDFYLQRKYGNQDQADFSWLIDPRDKLGADTDVLLYLIHQHNSVTIYKLPLTSGFYRHEVRLIYDQKQRQLFLERSTDRIPLKRVTNGR